jgi:hypothetical protein
LTTYGKSSHSGRQRQKAKDKEISLLAPFNV